MIEQQSSYRQIMKATSLFGGVQIFNILISIIRSKFIAVLLGPAGMGIMGLLTSTTGIISNLSNFGLGTSAVKDIAAAYGTGDEKRIRTVISVFRRIVWITGFLGLIITIILAPWLSELTFANKNYTSAFIWLSLTLLFNQLSSGQLVILQGMRRLNFLAKANIYGTAIGLFVTIPFFFFWRIEGIVPSIITTALISLVISLYFSRKVNIEKIGLSGLQTFKEGQNMLRMGFLISLSGLFSACSAYIVRLFISHTGGVEQVGLYNAGFTIINIYVGLVFNAISTDYFPRLSEVAMDNKLCKQSINQQSEIALLILAPILLIFLIFINWVVIIFFSKQFIAVNGMIYWAALGMFFKTCSWSIAFVFLAKGANNLYFWNNLGSNIYDLGLNILGYYFWGLTGLGISFVISYAIYLFQVYAVSSIKYDFKFDREFIKIFGIQFSLAIAGFGVTQLMNQPYNFIIGIFLILFSGWYSIKELDKRLGLLSLLKNLHYKL